MNQKLSSGDSVQAETSDTKYEDSSLQSNYIPLKILQQGSEVTLSHQLQLILHSHLSEVSRMELVKVNPVMVLTTGITATSRMLPVLA